MEIDSALYTDLIDFTTWKTSKQVEKELSIIANIKDINRAIRKSIAENNELFLQGKREHYIVHGGKGYKWAANEDEIALSLEDLEQRAKTMLRHTRYAKKRLSERYQTSIENNLRAYRRSCKLTLQELADKAREYPDVKCTMSSISQIERGMLAPSRAEMFAFSQVLDASIGDLFGIVDI